MKLRYLWIVPLLKAIGLCSGSIGERLVALLMLLVKNYLTSFAITVTSYMDIYTVIRGSSFMSWGNRVR